MTTQRNEHTQPDTFDPRDDQDIELDDEWESGYADGADEPEDRVNNTYFGDQEYYDLCHPWSLVLANAPELRRTSQVRLLSGRLDTRLAPTIRDLDHRFTELDVPHDFFEFPDADHEYADIMDGYGDKYYAWWRTV